MNVHTRTTPLKKLELPKPPKNLFKHYFQMPHEELAILMAELVHFDDFKRKQSLKKQLSPLVYAIRSVTLSRKPSKKFNFKGYYNVSHNGYVQDLESATLIKSKKVALAILATLSSDNHVIDVFTKLKSGKYRKAPKKYQIPGSF